MQVSRKWTNLGSVSHFSEGAFEGSKLMRKAERLFCKGKMCSEQIGGEMMLVGVVKLIKLQTWPNRVNQTVAGTIKLIWVICD